MNPTTTIVMSGVTRGIGKEAVRRIADATPNLALVLLARQGANLAWVHEEFGDRCDIHVVDTDLDSMSATAAAADQVAELVSSATVPAISALVLNAGVQHVDACHESADGLEDTFAVNVVANHVLVSKLAPKVRRGGRIVITVSDTHFGDLRHNLGMVPGPRWTVARELAEPGSFPEPQSVSAGRIAYSTSKLAAIYQVHEYARRYPDLVVLGYNPGFVPGTGLVRDANAASRFVMGRVLPAVAKTPIPVASTFQTAAENLADLAVGEGTFTSGSYINRARVERSSSESYDPQREADLVGYLDELTSRAADKRQ